MSEPDYIYDPHNWEVTHAWRDRDMLADEAEIEFEGGVYRFETLVKGPEKFCIWTGDGYQWFDSLADAEAALSTLTRD